MALLWSVESFRMKCTISCAYVPFLLTAVFESGCTMFRCTLLSLLNNEKPVDVFSLSFSKRLRYLVPFSIC